MQPLKNILLSLEKNKKYHFWIFFATLVFLSLFMIFSFHPWDQFYSGDDTHFHMQRMQCLMDALKNNEFPIYLDNNSIENMGYPTKWFYPDILLVPFAVIGNFTDIIFAYKSLYFTSTVLCGIFMFIAMKRILNNRFAAYISALVFTFSLYRMQDLFERMAVGEAISFTILPIVFLGLYEIIKGDYNKWYILAIGYSLMICNHIISTILMAIITIIILLISYKSFIKEKKRFLYLMFTGVATCFISAYFLYPMIEQAVSNTFYYTTHPTFTAAGSALPFFVVLWGLGTCHIISNPYKFFVPAIGSILITLIFLRFFIWKKKSASLEFADKSIILGLFLLIITSEVFPWYIYPFYHLDIIQFPWRFYEFSSFFFALGGAVYLSTFVEKFKLRCLATLVIILATVGMIVQESYLMQSKANFTMEKPNITTDKFPRFNWGLGFLEYIPSSVPSADYLKARADKTIAQHNETTTTNFTKTGSVVNLDVSNNQPEIIELPLIYYKGYRAKLDDKEIPVTQSKHGLVELPVKQSGHIMVEYSGTLIQKVSPFISLISLFLTYIYYKLYRKKRKLTKE